MLKYYNDFVALVMQAGFLPLSHSFCGIPALTGLTDENNWHTGDGDTDPWIWKDRAAAEKKLAYGCILGGNKGFIAPWLYPAFYVCCHPELPMPERWADGEVNVAVWKLWQLFAEKGSLDTSNIRYLSAPAISGSKLDAAIVRLQKEFYITVAGSRRKLDKKGMPYGWPACIYENVPDWAPHEWLQSNGALDQDSACAQIWKAAGLFGCNVDERAFFKHLGIKC